MVAYRVLAKGEKCIGWWAGGFDAVCCGFGVMVWGFGVWLGCGGFGDWVFGRGMKYRLLEEVGESGEGKVELYVVGKDSYRIQREMEDGKVRELLSKEPFSDSEVEKSMVYFKKSIYSVEYKEGTVCSVCKKLILRKENESYVVLPKCLHTYHETCFKTYLKKGNNECAECKRNIRLDGIQYIHRF